jgi:hypothetical protein
MTRSSCGDLWGEVMRASGWRRVVLFMCTLGASVGCANAPATQHAATAPSSPATAPLVTQKDSIRPTVTLPPFVTDSNFRRDRIVEARVIHASSAQSQPQRLTASFMLQIAGEGDSGLANASTLSNLLTTTPILEPALAAADISMEQWRRASGTITAQSTAPQLVTVVVALSDDGKLPTGAAEKILGGACEQAIAAVLAAWDRQDAALTSQLTPLLEKSDLAKEREEAAQKAAAELREKMDAQRNGGDRNRSVRESLLNEKRETERTLAADAARLKSMESVAPVQTADEVVGPLAKEAFQKADAVVEFRKKRLEELRELAKNGKASAEEVAAAEFAVADARLSSIAYTATLTGLKNLAGYIVQRPNDPRPELRATVAAMEAKLKVLNDQIAEVADPKDQPPPVTQGQIERAQNTASNARRDYDTLMQQIDRLRSQNRLGARPKIAVLGKDSSPASPAAAK